MKDAVLEDVRQTVASAVVWLFIAARKIIVFTRHGTIGRHTSNLRPEHATIFAFLQVRKCDANSLWGVSGADKFPEIRMRPQSGGKYLREAIYFAGRQSVIIAITGPATR